MIKARQRRFVSPYIPPKGTLHDALTEGAGLLDKLRGEGRRKAIVYIDGWDLEYPIWLSLE